MPNIFPFDFFCVLQGREGRRSQFALGAAGDDITRSTGTSGTLGNLCDSCRDQASKD